MQTLTSWYKVFGAKVLRDAMISQVQHYQKVISALELSKNWVITTLKRNICFAKMLCNRAWSPCSHWGMKLLKQDSCWQQNRVPSLTVKVTWATRYSSLVSAGEHLGASDLWKVMQARISGCIPTAHQRFLLPKMVPDKSEEKANNTPQRKAVLQTCVAEKPITSLSELTFLCKYFDSWKITTTLLTKVTKKLWERSLLGTRRWKREAGGKGFLVHWFLPAFPVSFFPFEKICVYLFGCVES